MSRRSFLYRVGAAALGLLGRGTGSARAEGGATVLTILHTNDIHGHLTAWRGWEGELKGKTVGGFGRLAGAIAAAKKRSKDAILLDAGDLLGDSMIADLTEGKAMIDALNHLGYDALTVGNHEPDFGMAVLRERVKDARFAVVAANLVGRESRAPFVEPWVVKKAGGVTVGILGLAYPKTAWTTAAKNVAGVEFLAPAAAVERCLPKMREVGVDVVVVLSHLGLGGDEALARAVPGIDVIVGGHSHNRMARAAEVGSTLIVQAGAHGSDLGRLDLTIRGGRVAAHARTLTPLDHDAVEADAAAERFVAGILAPHARALDEVVGRAGGWLIRAQTIAGQDTHNRDEESPIDSLFADILREATGADVAFLPGVGYGVAIAPGPITAAQLRQMVPHEGKVVTMRLSGAQIVEVLEQAVENTFTDDPAVKVGGMVQVSGIRFRYDPKRAKGDRVRHVERTEGPWDLKAAYAVATNSMLAGGGHNYLALTKGESRAELGSQYRMVREWFEKHSPVSTPKPGRIERREAPKT